MGRSKMFSILVYSSQELFIRQLFVNCSSNVQYSCLFVTIVCHLMHRKAFPKNFESIRGVAKQFSLCRKTRQVASQNCTGPVLSTAYETFIVKCCKAKVFHQPVINVDRPAKFVGHTKQRQHLSLVLPFCQVLHQNVWFSVFEVDVSYLRVAAPI